jgi:hypothetical protein
MSKLTSKEALQKWEAYKKSVEKSTELIVETDKEKIQRIAKLKGNFAEFCKFYFPNYCKAEFAPFQLAFAKKVIDNPTIYATAAWSREHAKSVILGLFLPTYLMFTGKMKNMLLISYTKDNADELLMPIMGNLEVNQRIINDFGRQKSWRGWEIGKFVTANGYSFRAIGAGQSPRGSRNEEARPDFVLFDERLDALWQWIERAVIPTSSVSEDKRYLFAGNIIGKKSIIVRAIEKSDFHQVINILDKKGKPSWAKNTMDDINYMLSKISYFSGQQEYFNNPINEGSVFTEVKYDKIPSLSKFDFLINYCDSSYSNSKKNDFKALVLLGILDSKVYIIKAYLEQTTLAKMVDWFYLMKTYVGDKTQIYNFVECNGFQDPWYEDVFKPALNKAEATKGIMPVNPDDRKKPDKFSRIEGNLEPLNRRGDLIFNIAEKSDPHMMRLEEQFLALEPALSAHDDGPDATEGAYYIANEKRHIFKDIKVGKFKRTSKKY